MLKREFRTGSLFSTTAIYTSVVYVHLFLTAITMTLTYKIAAQDFLTYQLYTATTSERVQKQRFRNKAIIAFVFSVLGFVMLYKQDFVSAVFALGLALAWYLFSPAWERRRYVNHYSYFIAATYKERLDQSTTLIIGREEIFAKDAGSETKVVSSEVEEITELPTIILLKLKTGASFVLPKSEFDVPVLVRYLKEMAQHWGVPYHEKLAWKWK